jgi:hypothetical protein
MRRSREVISQADQAADAMLLDVEIEPGAGDDLTVAVSAALAPRARPGDFAPLIEAVESADAKTPQDAPRARSRSR